jgi:hypothetical protein
MVPADFRQTSEPEGFAFPSLAVVLFHTQRCKIALKIDILS